MSGAFVQVLSFDLLLLPGFISLALGLHLISVAVRGVPLAAYAALLFTPIAALKFYPITHMTVLTLVASTIVTSVSVTVLYTMWQRIADLLFLLSDQRILCELFLQLITISLCSLIIGPSTYLFPEALSTQQFLLIPNTSPEQIASFLFALSILLIFLPFLLAISRHQRLLLLFENRQLALQAGISSPRMIFMMVLLGMILISSASISFVLDHGFNVTSLFMPFLYGLSVSLLVPGGAYLLLSSMCAIFVIGRGISIVVFGSWIDDILAFTIISVAVAITFRQHVSRV
jgi:hypothetical protein